MNDTFCPLPWVGLDITPSGNVKPCCKHIPAISTSINDYFTSPALAKLRQDFNEGKKPDVCKRCWDDEAAGVPSKRQLDLQYKFNNQIPNLSSLKVVSLPFGNTCNLACRICSSVASSKWLVDEHKLVSKFPEITIYKHNKYYQDREFLEQIKSISKDCIHIDFPGGEPFVTGVDEQIEFLNFLVKQNPKETSLHYTTNTTTWPDQRFWSRWAQFKNVDIQLSIDSIASTFEYQRWPAIWNECYTNIKRYQALNEPWYQLSISHTVSIFNVIDLPVFLRWCKEQGLPDPYLGMVSQPACFSITSLPLDIKQLIVKTLPNNVASYMMSKDTSSLFKDSLRRIHAVDLLRNQQFESGCPSLFNMLDIEHRNFYQSLSDAT